MTTAIKGRRLSGRRAVVSHSLSTRRERQHRPAPERVERAVGKESNGKSANQSRFLELATELRARIIADESNWFKTSLELSTELEKVGRLLRPDVTLGLFLLIRSRRNDDGQVVSWPDDFASLALGHMPPHTVEQIELAYSDPYSSHGETRTLFQRRVGEAGQSVEWRFDSNAAGLLLKIDSWLRCVSCLEDGDANSVAITPVQQSYVFAGAIWIAYKEHVQKKVGNGEELKSPKRLDAYPAALALGWEGDKKTFYNHAGQGEKPRWIESALKKAREIVIPE